MILDELLFSSFSHGSTQIIMRSSRKKRAPRHGKEKVLREKMVRPLGREGRREGREGGLGGGLIRSRRVALMQSHQPVSGCHGTVARARIPFQNVFGPIRLR